MQKAVEAPAFGPGAPADFGGPPQTPRVVPEFPTTHELILRCLPLVDSIARRVYGAIPPNSCVDRHDLAQSGVLGLVSAGRCYDPAMDVPFAVYARYRIEGEMLDSLRRQDGAPRKLRRWQKQVSAARAVLAAALQREPTEEELCERLMVSAAEMRSRNQALRETQSPVPAGQLEHTGVEDAASNPETGPDHLCAQRELREVLDRLIEALPARHRQVIRLHYGQHLTMKEIGADMGVNESRVSQMHRSALRAMGRRLKNSGICSRAQL